MREILFRGKDPESGEWHYGYYVKRNDGDRGGLILEDYYLESYEIVKHETVGQYTGLTDKNGVNIFEGDIVKYIEIDIDGSDLVGLGVISWNQKTACFTITNGAYRNDFCRMLIEEIEVIGNIYDNPELMEVEE